MTALHPLPPRESRGSVPDSTNAALAHVQRTLVRGAATVLMLAVAAALIPGWLTGCTTLRGAARIDEMTAEEFAGWEARAAIQVGLVAQAALAEGDVTPEALERVAAALQGLADGSSAPAAGGVGAALDLQGYGALALALAVTELDARLAELGAYGEGWERGRAVLGAVAGALRGAAQAGGGQ